MTRSRASATPALPNVWAVVTESAIVLTRPPPARRSALLGPLAIFLLDDPETNLVSPSPQAPRRLVGYGSFLCPWARVERG
jgi:hypothetical protein